MAEHATVLDVSRYFPAAGRRDELVEAMHTLAAAAARAQGCFGSQVCVSDREPDALVAVSRWESAEAMRTFADSPDFVGERERLMPLLGRPAEREHLSSA